MEKPKVSIIVPLAPWDKLKVIEKLKKVDCPKEKMEIFVIEGTAPSKQRNEGIKKSKGEIIIFLDNDSEIPSNYINQIINLHKSYDIVGGPAETSKEDTFLGKCFGYVLGSYLATQSMQAKFKGVGKIRNAGEKELILCNMSIKKKVLDKYGNFNEKLYPNEENELINRLQSNGVKTVYDPNLKIFRKQRENLYKFSKQFFKYGKSRMEHFVERPKSFNFIFFIPSIFVIYLLSLSLYNPFWYIAPLVLYIILDLVFSLKIAFTEDIKSILITPLLFPLVHISYGIGIIRGIFKTNKQIGGKIKLSKIKI